MASAGLLALTACGPQEEPEPEAEPAETETDEAQSDAEEPEESPEAAEDGDDGEGGEDDDGDSAHQESSETELPAGGTERLSEEELDPQAHGEETQTYFSDEGTEVGVAGLEEDDSPIDVHAEPAAESDVVAELEATDAVLLGGRERDHPDHQEAGIWKEVELADGFGWVDTGNLYFFGSTEDVTEEFIDEVPPAETPAAIAESVGEHTVEPWHEDGAPPEAGGSVLISAPEDTGEEFYRVDATGMPDDSVGGYRLFVTVQEAGDGYELVQVERTDLCQRAVSEDGLCA